MEAGTPGKRTSAAHPAAACDHLLLWCLVVPCRSLGRQGPVPALLGANTAVHSPELQEGATQSKLDRWRKPGCDRDGLPTHRGSERRRVVGPGARECLDTSMPDQEPGAQRFRTHNLAAGQALEGTWYAPPRGRRRPQSLPQGPEAGHFGAKPAMRVRINRVDSIKWIFPVGRLVDPNWQVLGPPPTPQILSAFLSSTLNPAMGASNGS